MMGHAFRTFVVGAGLTVGLAGGVWGEPPAAKLPSSHERTAGPPPVAGYAHPTNSPAFDGDYVGGGGKFRGGEPRDPSEGTWGWDYVGGCWLPHHVFLSWNHGSNYQRGIGSYKTDGPHLPKIPHLCSHEE